MHEIESFKIDVCIGAFRHFQFHPVEKPRPATLCRSYRCNGIPSGIIAAISTLTGIAFSIPAGMLSDRFGRKTMLIAAGVVFASAPAMYLFTTGIWQLATIRFYHGLATAIFVPVAMAYVSDLHEESKGEKLGWFSTATLLGRFMAPLTGGALLGYLGSSSNLGFAAIYSVCLAGGGLTFMAFARMPPASSSP